MGRAYLQAILAVGFLISATASLILAQKPEAKADFEKPLLTFDMRMYNPSKEPRVVVKIGVRSLLHSNPSFNCMAGSEALMASSEYIVRFHVIDEETVINAEPPLVIEPNGVVRFKVSLIPDATGACGYWATWVSGIAILDDGAKVYSSKQLLTKTDVDEYEKRTPQDQEILDALRSRDADIRVLAIENLQASTIQSDTIQRILENKLEDRDTRVRVKAAAVASKMRLKPLAGKIASLLSSAPSGSKEKFSYAGALESLKEPVAVDALVDYLKDLEEESPFQARDVLIGLGHPDVPFKVRQLLINKGWAAGGRPERVRGVNDAVCAILLHYRDMKSVPLLSRLIVNAEVSGSCLADIRGEIGEDRIVQDPFILAMRPAVEAALKSPDQTSRLASVDILCQLTPGLDFLGKVIADGLGDSDSLVRRAAARCAAEHGFTAFVDRIISNSKSSTDPSEKESYCEALKKLNATCN